MNDTPRPQGLRHVWPEGRPLVGMVHLLPLPGSPRWGGSIAAVQEQAATDARALWENGMDGVLVENFLDAPFFGDAVPPETVAAMARVVGAVVAETNVPVGVNVLRNDARAALAVAAACDAAFVRVNVHTGSMWTDQGLLEGRAAETVRARATLGPHIAILADVLVKHAVPPSGLRADDAASDAWHRGLADALVATGAGTGRPTPLERVREIRTGAPSAPVLVGSGVTPETVARILAVADGAIVGTALTREGRAGTGIDGDRVKALVEAARG